MGGENSTTTTGDYWKTTDKWVQFYRDGQRLYDCNASYAAANFVCVKR